MLCRTNVLTLKLETKKRLQVNYIMDCFSDLEKSSKLDDKMIYCFITHLLDQLYGQHKQVIIPSGEESEDNQQLIRDQWIIISYYFKLPRRIKATQKMVRQTLKNIVDYLNRHYQFKHPITFNLIKKNVWQDGHSVSFYHTEMFFE